MAQALSWDPAPPEFVLPGGMDRDRFDAMGTRISVLIPEHLSLARFARVRALFMIWEQTLSRFRQDSELSYVNGHASESVTVSPLFFRVLITALEAARATDGIYDPTLLHQLVGAGHDRSFTDLPPSQPAATSLASPGGGWRAIRVDQQDRTVTLPPRVALDFGGIAKGMVVDAALEQLIALGAPQAAVEAGGDLRVFGHPPGEQSWPVSIQVKDGHETVSLYGGALATSSVARRQWKQGEVRRHHLLDPRSGEPAETGLWSVTVAASSCTQADVAAKTAFVLGPDEGTAFLVTNQLAALLIMRDGEQRRVGSWPRSSALPGRAPSEV